MTPTPFTTHLKLPEFSSVYDPAEDTFILLDALDADATLSSWTPPLLCLEIGSGSGCVSAFVAKLVGPSAAFYLCTDLHDPSTRATARTATLNYVPLNPIRTDLVASLLPRLKHSVDLLIFNPPYVETGECEAEYAQAEGGIERAWAGGADGMIVTNRLLTLVEELLSENGVFYLVAVPQNKPEEIIENMRRSHNLAGKIVLKRRAGYEYLQILRFSRLE